MTIRLASAHAVLGIAGCSKGGRVDLAELQTMLEHLKEVFLRVDSRGVVTYVNHAWEKLCDQPVNVVVGRKFVDFAAEPYRAKLAAAFEALESAQAADVTIELRLERQASTIHWIELYARACENAAGQPDGLVIHLYDISERKRAETASTYAQMLFEQASDVILVVGLDMSIVDANPAAERLYGYTRDELKALNIADLRDPSTLAQLPHDVRRVMETGARFETLHRRRDGTPIPVEVSSQWTNGDDGAVLISIVRDMTAHKQHEEALKKSHDELEIIIDGVSDGIVAIDAERQVIYINETAARFYSEEAPADLVGRHLGKLIAPYRLTYEDGAPVPLEDIPGSVALRGELMRNRRYCYVSRATGAVHVMSVSATPAFDEHRQVRFAIVILHDITEQTELERLKSDFLNAVTHELRTPLTSIKGYAEFLEDGIGGELSPDQAAFVGQIQLGTAQLEILVDDLLDFARIEAGKFTLRLQTVDVAALIQRIAAMMRPQAEQSGLVLTVEAPSELVAEVDPGRVTQILNNLVSNAVKFTPTGGTIALSLVTRPGSMRLKVVDSGIGISPEHLPRLFSKFFQVDSSLNRSFKGTGLGLAITKALVEAHHGTISVESESGVGTAFTIDLPLRQPVSDRPAAGSARRETV